MKKINFAVLIITLVLSFVLSLGVNGVMAADKDKYGGTLAWNHTKTADVIGDPLLIRGWNHTFVDFVLQPLLTVNHVDMAIIEPNLATSYEMAGDRSSCIFKLRKGVKFHDGTDFNANAVKWNFDRYIADPGPMLDTVTSVELLDDYTIKLNMSEWDSTFIMGLTKNSFIISPSAYEKFGAKGIKYKPVGTGAFKVTKYKRKAVIEYEKNKDYWKEGLPYLDKVRASQIGDPMTAMASLKRGELDVWINVDPVSGAQIRDQGKFDVMTTPGTHDILQFNSKDPNSIWSDKRVRQALEYAIDKEAICKALGHGFMSPVYEVIHSISLQGDGPGTTPRKYDPEKAKQLLKEAGVPKGVEVKFSYTAGSVTHSDMAVAIQGMLENVGIHIVPNPLAGAAMNVMSFQPPPPNMIIVEGQRGALNDFVGPLKESFGENAVYFQGIKQPEGFLGMLKEALQTDDWATTLDLCFKMERLAYEDATLIALDTSSHIVLQNPRVQDALWFVSGAPFPYLEKAWIKK